MNVILQIVLSTDGCLLDLFLCKCPYLIMFILCVGSRRSGQGAARNIYLIETGVNIYIGDILSLAS